MPDDDILIVIDAEKDRAAALYERSNGSKLIAFTTRRAEEVIDARCFKLYADGTWEEL